MHEPIIMVSQGFCVWRFQYLENSKQLDFYQHLLCGLIHLKALWRLIQQSQHAVRNGPQQRKIHASLFINSVQILLILRVKRWGIQSLLKKTRSLTIQLDVHNNYNYHTSDSLWKIWLVEIIQSIHNCLWTWHDKCNICCRYYIYHVKFNVCLVTKPLGVFSETKWLKASLLFLRMNYVKNV